MTGAVHIHQLQGVRYHFCAYINFSVNYSEFSWTVVAKKSSILLRRVFRFIQNKIAVRTITVIGDSHARVFSHDLFRLFFPFTYFDVCCVDGATLSGLDNPNSVTQGNAHFRKKICSLKKKSIVIFLLGEVDTGFVIWYRHQMHGGTIDAMLNKALSNYFELISLTACNHHALVISAPLPTISDDNDWGNVANLRKDVKATQFERTKLTLKFNELLAFQCRVNGIRFLNLDVDSLGSNGLVGNFLLNADTSDHHYKQVEYSRLIIRKLFGKV